MQPLRNIAIIAHVDHGKTTLVDALLRQSQTKLSKEKQDQTCVMDSNELERERGITIFSKNASVRWRDYKINIIDTPGHADFGGEVERVLKMADGCLLLIDAQEGPMPQTRFVLKKALEMDLKVIVIINKIDKPAARCQEALNKTFDLFIDLGATDQQADFPVIYAASKLGLAGWTPELAKMTDINPVFEAIVKHIPAPTGDPAAPLQILISNISYDDFKGRLAIGRIHQGTVKAGQEVVRLNRQGQPQKFRLTALLNFVGLEKKEITTAPAGEIICVAGVSDINIGETLADPLAPHALPLIKIEEPTVKMTFLVNNSPFAGKEGEFTTSRQVQARLFKELENDMALKVESTSEGQWIVSGRGELHLAILIERMRREGYEFQVSRPQVITKVVAGKKMTPYEKVYLEVPQAYSGAVIQELSSRQGEMLQMQNDGQQVHLEFLIPTAGLFGYRSQFLSDTRGLGIMNTLFAGYHPDPGQPKQRQQGSLVSFQSGSTNLYGLLNTQGRGTLFLGPGQPVYKGQIVGQNCRMGDLRINVCKTKQLSNMRSKGEGVSEHFKAPRVMDLEAALEYIDDTELVEVTPQNIRLRKIILDPNEGKKISKGIK